MKWRGPVNGGPGAWCWVLFSLELMGMGVVGVKGGGVHYVGMGNVFWGCVVVGEGRKSGLLISVSR